MPFALRRTHAPISRPWRPLPPLRLLVPSLRTAVLASVAAATLGLAAPAAIAQEGGLLARPPAHARIGYERIRFPEDEHVGLLGTTYLVDVPSVP